MITYSDILDRLAKEEGEVRLLVKVDGQITGHIAGDVHKGYQYTVKGGKYATTFFRTVDQVKAHIEGGAA